jgi:FkbM family methyltransferase
MLRKILTQIFKNAAEKLNCTIIGNWRIDTYAQSEYMRKLFDYLDIDCVFDVGANEGQYGEFLRNMVGYKGLIISFEPIQECFDLLRNKSLHDPNWLIHPIALGDSNGCLKFNVMAGSQFSSFLDPDDSKLKMFSERNIVLRPINVEMKTLHDIVPEIIKNTGVKSLYLKLDTQGFDLNVARGAQDQLMMFRALQTEASVTPIYKGAPSFAETLTFFQRSGYELSGIFPNNPDHFPRMIEFDCHMIRHDMIPIARQNAD